MVGFGKHSCGVLFSFLLNGPSCDDATFLTNNDSHGVCGIHVRKHPWPRFFQGHCLNAVRINLDITDLDAVVVSIVLMKAHPVPVPLPFDDMHVSDIST
jgi:hypothetical protein